MRGTPPRDAPPEKPPRFIPAHAGNASRASRAARITSVHPRACGERQNDPGETAAGIGSSPRMRGTRLQPGGDIILDRFIPAHAGNAGAAPPGAPTVAVHPRACGERCRRHLTVRRFFGSSPRMRGTRHDFWPAENSIRFIPAHAGNAIGLAIQSKHPAVHPRACGERSLP